jgi:hypothetical protein
LPLFNVISVPPFHAILVERWNAPAHRYFLAYRALGVFRHVMGLPVVDEFATFSTPIFFGPVPLLGQLYNAGITLGHQRSPEMSLDQGWPPICIGIETNRTAEMGWENKLLDAIKAAKSNRTDRKKSEYEIQHHRIGEAEIFATNAPFLPKQLHRLCESSQSPLSIAFSTGNRITGQNGKLLSVQVASEATLKQIIHRFSTASKTT